MNTREEKSDAIPDDLIVEIFSRLPTKSIERCRCLSKLWRSILHRPYFTELFLTRSWSRPRLLLSLRRGDEWSFHSSLQPHDPHDKSSPLLVANSEFHMKFPEDMRPGSCDLTSAGLIYFSKMRISKKDEDKVPFICNPITGQYSSLPKPIRSYRESEESYSFLGFDPIDKKFKVLFICDERKQFRIMTLETEEMRWRMIKCPLAHYPWHDTGICINGVLYYFTIRECSLSLVCFDVRSEEFKKSIDARCISLYGFRFINYKGKLGVISKNKMNGLCMWVLEEHEWSEYVYTLPENPNFDRFNVFIVGMTATGEIVLSERRTSERFYVFYFNPQRSALQRVEILGLENHSTVYACVDHIEDLNVNDAKYIKSKPRPKPQKRDLCDSAPSVKTEEQAIDKASAE